MTVEELMRRELDGKFFPYIGKPEQKTLLQIKAEEREATARQAREIARIKAEESAKRKAKLAARVVTELTYIEIIAAVALVHDVSVEEIYGTSRKTKIALARHHAVFEIKSRKPDFTLTKIGNILNRDHTTIVNSMFVFGKDKQKFAAKLATVAQILGPIPVDESLANTANDLAQSSTNSEE